MSWFNRNGVWIRVKGGGPADVENDLREALNDLQNLKDRNPHEIKAYTRPGRWTITSTNGRDEIKMAVGEQPGKEPTRKPFKETIRMPVPAFELVSLYQEAGNEFRGFYICESMAWSPSLFDPPDPDRELYFNWIDNIAGDGLPNQYPDLSFKIRLDAETEADIRILRLEQVGENDHEEHEWDGDTTKDGIDFSPGLCPNPPGWQTSFECPKNDGNCFACVGGTPGACDTGFFTSLSFHTGVGQRGSYQMIKSKTGNPGAANCPENKSFEFGMEQTYWRSKVTWSSTVASLAGTTIATGTSYDNSYTEGYADGAACNSHSYSSREYTGGEPYCMMSSTTRDAENYGDDEAWIALYEYYTWNHQHDQTISPWEFAPYFEPWPIADPPLMTQTYHCRVHTSTYDKTFQFAAPDIGNYYGDGTIDSVSCWTCEIWDYYGEPVFIFTWHDERGDTANYGMVFAEEIYISEAYPVLGVDKRHVVGQSDQLGDGGYGWLSARAVAYEKDIYGSRVDLTGMP